MNKHLPQLFSFFVEGAMKWYANDQRLPKPQTVVSATQRLISENDTVQKFIDEACARDPAAIVATAQLFEVYQKWWDSEGQLGAELMKKNVFTATLRAKGFEVKGAHIAVLSATASAVHGLSLDSNGQSRSR
jgi:phage/plasmid-associated DNA primase